MPNTLEAVLQCSGRAGRNGEQSYICIFNGPKGKGSYEAENFVTSASCCRSIFSDYFEGIHSTIIYVFHSENSICILYIKISKLSKFYRNTTAILGNWLVLQQVCTSTRRDTDLNRPPDQHSSEHTRQVFKNLSHLALFSRGVKMASLYFSDHAQYSHYLSLVSNSFPWQLNFYLFSSRESHEF